MNDNMLKENRRSFLKTGIALGGLSLLPPVIAGARPTLVDDKVLEIIAGPYLQTSFNDEMSVLWVTTKNCKSWVAYGESPSSLDKVAYGDSNLGLKPAGRLNCIKLKGLKPNCTYYYQICSTEILEFQPYKVTYGKTITKPVETFLNPDIKKDEISFVMLNDIHDRPNSIPELLNLDKVSERDFIFFNGDIFDYQTDEKQLIDHMIKPCVDYFAKTKPFLYVRGNHETRGKFARNLPEYFDHVTNTAFTLGPVRFVVLDTGEDKEDEHPVYADLVDFDYHREQQAIWLAQEMSRKEFKKAAFRIVLMHIPPRYSGNAHGATHCTQLFEPLMNSGKVDLVLSGHTHKYKIHSPAKGLNSYPIVIGGGPTKGSRTLTKIVANNQRIQVSLLNDSGAEVGSYSVPRR
ncbi:MAG: metallophosphoesterase family protein [Chitinophagaceae bacterium]|nr:MAG: metallophosphoesterase family protein [Chitinophagaceae bacterium]